MKTLLAAAAMALMAIPALAQSPQTVYEGGLVWTGDGFAPRDLVVESGRFVDPARTRPEARRVALDGGFVTPAYANAHAHVTQPTADSSRGFTDAGVFYVWNPNTVVLDASSRDFFGQAGRFRVKVAQGGITEPGGHPEKLYVDDLGATVYGGRPREWFLGNAFHYGRTEAEIADALLTIKRQGADFVKIYLLRSEDYDVLRDDPGAYGAKGLNPANVPFLVRRAHALGLPVAAHLETANDLRVAAEAGVDYAAHLPGYGGVSTGDLDAVRLTPEIATAVARSGMRVIPTYAIAGGGDRPSAVLDPAMRRAVDVQTSNLELLRRGGGRPPDRHGRVQPDFHRGRTPGRSEPAVGGGGGLGRFRHGGGAVSGASDRLFRSGLRGRLSGAPVGSDPGHTGAARHRSQGHGRPGAV